MAYQGQLTPDQGLAQALYPSVPVTQQPEPVAQPELAQGLQQAPPGVGPPQSPEQQAQRKAGWRGTLEKIRNDPDMLMTLITIGGAMMQNVPPGQSTGQHIAGAVGQGLSYQGRLAALRRQVEERKAAQQREESKLDLETAEQERIAGREELVRGKIQSETERNKAAAAAAGRPSVTVGKEQTLINFLARNAMKQGKYKSMAEAVDAATDRVLKSKDGRSVDDEWNSIVKDFLGRGGFPEDLPEMEQAFKESYRSEGGTAAGGKYERTQSYQGKTYGLIPGADPSKQESWRVIE